MSEPKVFDPMELEYKMVEGIAARRNAVLEEIKANATQLMSIQKGFGEIADYEEMARISAVIASLTGEKKGLEFAMGVVERIAAEADGCPDLG